MKARVPHRSFVALALVLLAGCGSVEVPQEHLYRLDVPPPATPPHGTGTMPPPVVRVQRVQLGAELAGERLLVASGAVHLRPYLLHRWAGPLDGLLTDAFVTAFARSGAFRNVKGPHDPGGEDLTVAGRVLDFHQVQQDGRPAAAVTVDLVVARGDEAVVREELRRVQPAKGTEPEAVVQALSAALAGVLDDAIARCCRAAAGDTAEVPQASPVK